MPWFRQPVDAQPERRQTVFWLLQCLAPYLPAPTKTAADQLEAGVSPDAVLSEFGRCLAELLARWQTYNTGLSARLQSQEAQVDWLRKENERLQTEPLRRQMKQAQQKVHELSGALSQAGKDLETVRRALAAEQVARQREVSELQAYVVSQNRIIAQQQLRLNGLLGETPSAETAGEKS